MIFKNKKIQSLISSLLILAVLLPSFLFFFTPKKAEAGWPVFDWLGGALKVVGNYLNQSTAVSSATTASYGVKEWAQLILQQTLQAIARKVLQELTKSTVNWINGGFHGSPLFLENSQSFFTDITKTEIKTLVNQFGYDPNKFPFGQAWALNTINSYKRTLDQNASYSLNSAMTATQATNFRNNFNVGGWNGFLINTQYPQNNYLGFNMLATDELARRVQGLNQTAGQKVQTALAQGAGFLSPQICQTNPNYNNMTNEFQKPQFQASSPYDPKFCQFNIDGQPTENEKTRCDTYNRDYATGVNIEKEKFNSPTGSTNCPNKADGSSGLVTTTPGSVVGSSIAKALGANQDQTTLAGAMGNSLSAILGAVVDHFLDKGLTALASTINPAPAADTWTYGGQSLDVNGSTNNDPFAGFDEVVVLKDFKKLLDGYFIGTCTLPVENSSDTPVKQNDMPKAECDTAKGTWTKNPAGTDYIPGDIANTDAEMHFMDNPPCDPADPTNCPPSSPSNPGNKNPDRKDFFNPKYYNPGIAQGIGEIWQKTKTLDLCVPGPDKGWENRLKLEQDRVSKPLQNEAGGGNDPDTTDELKVKAANDALRELKFAVDTFKDWTTTQMIKSLPKAILYMDEVNKIDDFAQQLKELTTSRRAKSSTLARLRAIKLSLDAFTDQPVAGSSGEQTLISLKKQYNAMRADISSAISLENTRNQLITFLEKSINLLDDKGTADITDDTGLVPECIKAREDAHWGSVDANGHGTSVNTNLAGKTYTRTHIETSTVKPDAFGFGGGDIIDKSMPETKTTTGTEIEQFCDLPIASGYSHGDVIRPVPSNLGGANYAFNNLDNPLGNTDPAPGYQDLPMVNAQNVNGDIVCTGLCSGPSGPDPLNLKKKNDKRLSIKIDCYTVFKASMIDYTHAGDPTF